MPLLLMEVWPTARRNCCISRAPSAYSLQSCCSLLLLSNWIVAITTVQKLCADASPSLFLYSAWRYSKSNTFGSKLEWVDIVLANNWPFWNMSATWNKQLMWHFIVVPGAECFNYMYIPVSSIVGALQSTHALVLNAQCSCRGVPVMCVVCAKQSLWYAELQAVNVATC